MGCDHHCTRGRARTDDPEGHEGRLADEQSRRLAGTETEAWKEFTEPVALSSTRPADLPLPRRTVGLSFDLLALRARCVEEPMGESRLGQVRGPTKDAFCDLLRARSFVWRHVLRREGSSLPQRGVSDSCQIRLTTVILSRRTEWC